MTLVEIRAILEVPLPVIESEGKDGSVILSATRQQVHALARMRNILQQLVEGADQ